MFTSDHGEMLGSHGGPPYMKHLPWDESARVPFLLRYPPPTVRRGACYNAADDARHPADLLGLAGVAVPDTVEGEDLSGLVRGEPEPADRAALYMAVAPFAGRGFNKEYRAIRTSRYTYVRGLEGPWLLFDDHADPHQLDNLVAKPEHAALVRDLDKRLQSQLDRIGDAFRPGATHIAEWGYEIGAHGSVPYDKPDAKPQTPTRRTR